MISHQALDPTVVSAIAASVTATTAVIAAAFALVGLRQNVRGRREQAKPYVAVFVEPRPSDPNFFDVVVKNFGRTAARDIAIEMTPSLERSDGQGGKQEVKFPTMIRTLVPDQEWRTWWDSMPAREQLSLPDQHIVRVRYHDGSRREPIEYDYDLDLGVYEGKMWVQTYGLHDGMKALREIERHLKKSREGLSGGFKVFVRDGDARDERRRDEHATRLRNLEQEQRNARLYLSSQAESDPEQD